VAGLKTTRIMFYGPASAIPRDPGYQDTGHSLCSPAFVNGAGMIMRWCNNILSSLHSSMVHLLLFLWAG